MGNGAACGLPFRAGFRDALRGVAARREGGNALSVGRVGDDKPIFFGMTELVDGTNLEVKQARDAGLRRIGPRGRDGIRVDIVALNVGVDGEVHHILRLFPGVLPVSLVDESGPVLGGEMTMHAGSNIRGDHGSLDRDGAASAERVYEDAVSSPGREQNKAGGEILGDRRLDGHPAVAALVKGLPAGINRGSDLILHEKDPDGVGVSVLRKHSEVVARLHLLHHRLFHHGLDVGRREERGLHRRGLGHPEFGVARQKLLPGKRIGALKQFFPRPGLELPHLQQNPFRRAQPDVGARNGVRVSEKSDAPVTDVRDLIAEVVDFVLYHAFHAEMTGCDELICLQENLLSRPVPHAGKQNNRNLTYCNARKRRRARKVRSIKVA